MTSYWSVVAMCWVVFWLYWTVSGWRVHAPKRTVSWAFTIPNTTLLYVGFVLMLIQRNLFAPLGIRFAPSADWLQATATVLVVLGVAFAIWSRFVLGVNWSATVRIHADQHVIDRGPYAFVAHPIYTGISLAAFGTALVGGTLGNALVRDDRGVVVQQRSDGGATDARRIRCGVRRLSAPREVHHSIRAVSAGRRVEP